MNPVRVYLALLLAVQFVVPLVPSWGAFVPHDHWARTPLTSADWTAHVQGHQVGAEEATATTTRTGESKIISTLSENGVASFHAPLADHSRDFRLALARPVLLHKAPAREFTVRGLAYPPLDQPPTL